jgi:hypothetical protein
MPESEEEWGPIATAEEQQQQQQDEFPREKKWTSWSEFLDDQGNGCGGVEEGMPDMTPCVTNHQGSVKHVSANTKKL